MPVPTTASEAADLLGIGIDAPADAVRERYRSLARVFHPDRNPHDDAAGERMLELNAAADLLLGSDAPTIGQILEPEEPSRSLTRRERRREAAIREALHNLPYGVYVIGTVTAEGQPNAMVADWVMQVAFKPRILAVSFERDASSLRNVRETRQLTVSLLPEEGMDLAARFLQPSDPSKVKGRSAAATAERISRCAGPPTASSRAARRCSTTRSAGSPARRSSSCRSASTCWCSPASSTAHAICWKGRR